VRREREEIDKREEWERRETREEGERREERLGDLLRLTERFTEIY